MLHCLLIAGWIQYTLCANIGVDVDGTKISASIQMSESEVICNMKDKEKTGCCVDAGTCGVKPLEHGKVNGKCAAKDDTGANKECCTLEVPCGETTHSYVSYFRNPSWPKGEKEDTTCNIKIAVKKKVCQVRLDFLDFELPPPDKKTGVCSSNNNMVFFTHSNPVGMVGGKKCGLNKNQHFYIPVGKKDKINIMTTITKHSKEKDHHETHHDKEKDQDHYKMKSSKWNIKITQIECDTDDKYFCDLEAPKGCLQYFTDTYGEICSFNYDEHARIGAKQDYAVCIKTNHKGTKSCSLTYRAKNFMMPVGGNDVGFCESGLDIVNNQTNRECCVDPKSSYLGFVGKQPIRDSEDMLTRRYWCGQSLGPYGEVTTCPNLAILKVFSGEKNDADLNYTPNGFKIDYKIDTGYC